MKNLLYILLGICCLFLSCNKKEKKEKKRIGDKIDQPFYMINLPDTVASGIPFIFEIKLSYPTTAKKENYFSHLILSDSVEITFDNLHKKKDLPYEIQELQTNHWKIRRTIDKRGDFIVRGGIFVSTIEFKNPKNDSIQVFEHEDIVPVERKVYIK